MSQSNMINHIRDDNYSEMYCLIGLEHPCSISFIRPIIKAVISQRSVYIFIADLNKSKVLYRTPTLSAVNHKKNKKE